MRKNHDGNFPKKTYLIKVKECFPEIFNEIVSQKFSYKASRSIRNGN